MKSTRRMFMGVLSGVVLGLTTALPALGGEKVAMEAEGGIVFRVSRMNKNAMYELTSRDASTGEPLPPDRVTCDDEYLTFEWHEGQFGDEGVIVDSILQWADNVGWGEYPYPEPMLPGVHE